MMYYYSKELKCIYVKAHCDLVAQQENHCPALWIGSEFKCDSGMMFKVVWRSKNFVKNELNTAARVLGELSAFCGDGAEGIIEELGNFDDLQLAIAFASL